MIVTVTAQDDKGQRLFARFELWQEGNLLQIIRGIDAVFTPPYKGTYTLVAHHGLLYIPAKQTIDVALQDISICLILSPLLNAKKWGLLSMDAHSHTCRATPHGNPATAAITARAEGFDFWQIGCPYDKTNFDEIESGIYADNRPYRQQYAPIIEAYQDDTFGLDVGGECIKLRYGHVFLLDYVQRPGEFCFDATFPTPQDILQNKPETPCNTPPIHDCVKKLRGKGVCLVAHPTAWWLNDDGGFNTNIASTLGFDLLCGAVDALCVLGYDRQKPAYEAVWHHALRQGYRLPCVAETDTFIDAESRLARDIRMKTYVHAKTPRVAAIARAIKAGRSYASSGPILRLTVNGRLPGSTLPFEMGTPYTAQIKAHACHEAPLSQLLLFTQTGELAFNLSGMHTQMQVPVPIHQEGFILAKIIDAAGNTCISSPIYIRNKPFVNDGFLASVDLVGGHGKYRIDKGAWQDFSHNTQIHVHAGAKISVKTDGKTKTYDLFHHPHLQQIFKYLYRGEFRRDYAADWHTVPPHLFAFDRIRDILHHVLIDVQKGDFIP